MARISNDVVRQTGDLVVTALVEVPRGSFVKRTRGGRITLISPLPCPFNYGSVPAYRGLDKDDLDVIVLGPRLARNTWLQLPAWCAVGLTDGGEYDDKLICSAQAPTEAELDRVLRFFDTFAAAKRVVNRLRQRGGATHCDGLVSAAAAFDRAYNFHTRRFGYGSRIGAPDPGHHRPSPSSDRARRRRS